MFTIFTKVSARSFRVGWMCLAAGLLAIAPAGRLAAAPVVASNIMTTYEDATILTDVRRDLSRYEGMMERANLTLEQVKQKMRDLTEQQRRQRVHQMSSPQALGTLRGRTSNLRLEGRIRANGGLDDHETVVKWRELSEIFHPDDMAALLFERLTPAMRDELLLEQLQTIEKHDQTLKQKTEWATDRRGLDQLEIATMGTTVVLAVVEPNLALFPADNQAAGQVRQQLAALLATHDQAMQVYDQQMAVHVAQRLPALEERVAKFEAVVAKGKYQGQWGPGDNLLYRQIHNLPTRYHTQRVTDLRQRIERLRAQAQGTPAEQAKAQTQMDQGQALAPLGRANDTLQAYFAALKNNDFAAAEAYLVVVPSVRPEFNLRHMKAYKNLADATPIAEYVIEDCGVVILREQSHRHDQAPAFLLKQNGVWKVSARLTTYLLLDKALSEEQTQRMKKLDDWSDRFRSDPAGAARTARPDLSDAPAQAAQATASHQTQATAAQPNHAAAQAPDDKLNAYALAAQKQDAAHKQDREQLERENKVSLERMRAQLKDHDPYLQAIGEEVYRRASTNYVIGNFCDPGKVAVLAVEHHLTSQQDPRLKSDDAIERLKARNQVNDRDAKARAGDNNYISSLLRAVDLSQASAPERIRRYGRARARDLLYLDVPNGKMTQAQFDHMCECVGEKMVREFDGAIVGNMKTVDQKFLEFVSECRNADQPKAAQTATAPQQQEQPPTAQASQDAPAPVQDVAHAVDEAERKVDDAEHTVDKAKDIGRKLRGLFGG